MKNLFITDESKVMPCSTFVTKVIVCVARWFSARPGWAMLFLSKATLLQFVFGLSSFLVFFFFVVDDFLIFNHKVLKWGNLRAQAGQNDSMIICQ